MKSYLNKDEKDSVLILESFVGFLENMIKKMEDSKKPKNIVKFAKMSKSFCYKVLDWMFEGLDQQYIHQLVKDIRKMEVITKYRNEAIRERKEMELLDSNTVVNTDDFNLIVEHALVICMQCKMCGEKAKNCKLRDVFIRNDVAVFNLEAGFNQCPYQPESELKASINIEHGLIEEGNQNGCS